MSGADEYFTRLECDAEETAVLASDGTLYLSSSWPIELGSFEGSCTSHSFPAGMAWVFRRITTISSKLKHDLFQYFTVPGVSSIAALLCPTARRLFRCVL
jgi:hypothetical protein